ncbi:cytochrome o ubiquinol oxidase subunit II [Pseudogulbenkiania sp. NH8B]|uniref:ubiquinol oxidase subunit II n=1 Tax=Pseudogulbenkiania sp. (strain NH8B) TaxID=748280 RepID=UPI0002279468|nr:ubiquinol oxidase subunit II [Pseudogulbenkiania sp. NH8B]BAK75336.1 cytochrome o ubiquinol oxidase subunit II [Pseudogulbenkiania sp. NH8B]
MINSKHPRILRGLPLAAAALLSGCQGGILDPKGQIAADEKSLIITATVLMLLVVVPVILMTLGFAWKYRASNKSATYDPKWSHSGKIEAVVWIIPIIIVSFLAVITWNSTHKLDPYRPLDSDKKPITIQVVSLDWKWLFIYPELNIASVNQLAFPANTPVNFKITSDAAMNSFFIPQLGGQIYSMAGMQTKLHLIANEPGSYDGMSANYSGAGFSGMKFKAIATASPAEFDAWVKQVRSGKPLDPTSYAQLLNPSENNPVQHFSSVTPGLFYGVLNKYMAGHQTAMEAGLSPIQLAALTKSLCKTPVVKE